MPNNPCVIATRVNGGQVHIFDYTKHPSQPSSPDARASPDLRLTGQAKDGYGLSWNSKRSGYLAGASDDTTVCIWDINEGSKERSSLKPLLTLSGHTAVAEDVAWHWTNEHLLASVGDDRKLLV